MDSDEAARYKLLDLCSWHIQQFSFVALYLFKVVIITDLGQRQKSA